MSYFRCWFHCFSLSILLFAGPCRAAQSGRTAIHWSRTIAPLTRIADKTKSAIHLLHNEMLSVEATRVSHPDCSGFAIEELKPSPNFNRLS
jgi:hypothetical protein